MPSQKKSALIAEYQVVVEHVSAAKHSELDEIKDHFIAEGVQDETFVGWAKRTLAEKRDALLRILPKPDGMEAPKRRKEPTMPRDPNWKPRTEKAWRIPYLAARRFAAPPNPSTRQYRRHYLGA